jgi:sulfite reductase (NADPH) hemoprotein beta-component
MNGLYLQLHAYMLRVAMPYGTLNSRRCACWATSPTSTIAAMATSPRARTSSTTGSSWRTRPTSWPIWPRWRCTPSRPAAIASATSRSDQYAGAAADEICRSAPLCRAAAPVVELPPGIHLPAAQVQDRGDRSANRSRGDALHDIGIQLVRTTRARSAAAFYVGGGMGRTPMIAP